MPDDPNGVHSLPVGSLVADGDVAFASQHNPPLQDISAGLTARLPRNGSAAMLGDLPMGGNKITGLADGVASTDAATKSQLDSINAGLVASVAGKLPLAGGTMTGDVILYGSAPLTSASAAPKSYVDAIYPVGSVSVFAGSTAPSGHLECSGQAVSRTTYSGLFSVVGTVFGIGDGSTTFNVPDLRGEFIRGWDHGRLVDTGRALGSAQADEIESHSHTENVSSGGGVGVGVTGVSASGSSASYLSTQATGGAETRPRNVALMYIIKH